MSGLIKIALLVIGGVVGLYLMTTIALTTFVHTDRFKRQLETVTSERLNMEFSVDGKVSGSLFPGLNITMLDVRLRTGEMTLATATDATLWVEFWPLLLRDIRIDEIALSEPVITIVRDKQGRLNVERTTPALDGSRAVSLPKVSLTHATLAYVDERSGRGFQASDCRLDISDLRLVDNSNVNPGNRFAFSSELDCEEIDADGFQVNDLELEVENDATDLTISPLSFQLFGAHGSGDLRANYAAKAARYQLQLSVPQFPIEAFFATLAPAQNADQMASGTMDFTASLSMQGETIDELIRTAEGSLSLRGEDLVLNGNDLDRQFDEFESSQHFNLVDVGAFFYAGPLGLVLSKGHDFSGILRGSGGHSEISSLVSKWQVEKGVATAVDVAMATSKHRIAMQGKLDFVNGRYDGVVIALIDADGCVKAEQKVHGDFLEPVVEQANVLKSLAGPVINLLKKGRDLFPGSECDVFYDGSVVP